MKIVVTLFISLLLISCATTELTVDANQTVKWKSWTLLKNVKDADVQWGTFHARLGSSFGDHETVAAIADIAWLNGGMLLDYTGQPRDPTAAEAAAMFDYQMNN
jgi:hypothetical protein